MAVLEHEYEAHDETRSPSSDRVFPAPEAAPEQLSVAHFRVGEDEFAVLSFPMEREALPTTLTTAEHAVLRGILRGESNGDIATKRGTSIRTVANQVQSIFRKLHVHSRAELSALLARTPIPESARGEDDLDAAP